MGGFPGSTRQCSIARSISMVWRRCCFRRRGVRYTAEELHDATIDELRCSRRRYERFEHAAGENLWHEHLHGGRVSFTAGVSCTSSTSSVVEELLGEPTA